MHSIRLEARSLPIGRYGVYRNGDLTDTRDIVQEAGVISISVNVGGQDVVLVLQGLELGVFHVR